jgi:Gnt-I system high-affinity gluconate transporter
MEIYSGLLLLAVFAIGVVLIVKGESPIIVLLSIAILWAALAKTPFNEILTGVLQKGAESYASAIVVIIFGAWFGQTLVQTGIAESVIRTAVELAGDRPFAVVIAVCLVTFFLFTSMYGVGAAIAVGVIALPVMMTMGVPPRVAAVAYTMSMASAYAFNLVNFSLYKALFKAEYEPYFNYYVVIGVVFFLFALAMAAINMRFAGVRKASAATVATAAERPRAPWFAYLAPAIPVIAVIVFKWPMIPSFMLGILYALVSTSRGRNFRKAIDLFHKTFYDAFPDVATIAALWIICGMLILAGQLPQVQAALKPLFSPILPSSKLGLVLFFGALTPLVLYRAPLGVVGTGAAVLAIFLSIGVFPGAILYLFWHPVLMVAFAQDPTHSWALWTIGYTKISQREFLLTGMPFAWSAAIVNLIIAYFWFQ